MTRQRLKQLLQAFSIAHKDERSATNINCPFCVGRASGRRDSGFRCGVFEKSLKFHCFRCHRTGSLYDILRHIVGMSWTEYKALVKGEALPVSGSLTVGDLVRQHLDGSKDETARKPKPLSMPKCRAVTRELVRQEAPLRRFLERRNISVDTCIDYGAGYTGVAGQYAMRLVVPVPDEYGRTIGWQGRDVTGRAKAKYLTGGEVMDNLYWTTHVEEPRRVYLVEGVYDCWRMGHNAVASFSKHITARQRKLLVTDDGIDELVVCWDWDAYDAARAAARDLGPIMRTGVVRMPEGEDPDSLGAGETRALEIHWT